MIISILFTLLICIVAPVIVFLVIRRYFLRHKISKMSDEEIKNQLLFIRDEIENGNYSLKLLSKEAYLFDELFRRKSH